MKSRKRCLDSTADYFDPILLRLIYLFWKHVIERICHYVSHTHTHARTFAHTQIRTGNVLSSIYTERERECVQCEHEHERDI